MPSRVYELLVFTRARRKGKKPGIREQKANACFLVCCWRRVLCSTRRDIVVSSTLAAAAGGAAKLWGGGAPVKLMKTVVRFRCKLTLRGYRLE